MMYETDNNNAYNNNYVMGMNIVDEDHTAALRDSSLPFWRAILVCPSRRTGE